MLGKKPMSHARSAFVITLLVSGVLSACANGQERLAPESISVEPTYNAPLDQLAAPDGPPVNPHLSPSSWPTSHRNSAKQASTSIPGPVGDLDVQVRYFEQDIGRNVGASPFMVLSGKAYASAPGAVTLWGATLTDVYKYVIDGERFEYVDHIRTSLLPLQMSWNMFTLAEGDRVIAPMPRGMRTSDARKLGCRGNHPAIAAFKDGDDPASPIICDKIFEYTPERLQSACGFSEPVPYSVGNLTAVLYNGDIATVIAHDRMKQPRPAQIGRVPSGQAVGRDSYLAIISNDLSRIKACSLIGETSITNQFSVERTSDTLNTMYLATGRSLVAMQYDTVTNALTRRASIDIPLRERTGTTPTLLGFSGDDQFVFLIDARCAVANIFTGEIECSKTRTGASRLIAVRRDFDEDAVVYHDLPEFIDTVENSPAAYGNSIVITNYSGYHPDGSKDGEPDFAKGVVKVSWDPVAQRFQTDWANPEVQISGIPTISAGSNMMYSSGAEPDGYTYFYGLRLNDDESGKGGEVLLRERVAISTPSRRGANDQVFDQGNGTLILDDGSAVFPGGPSLVRIKTDGD